MAADDPALLKGDDGDRVGGVAPGEGPAGMRDRVEHPGGRGVQRRGWVAEPVQRGALAVAQVPVAGAGSVSMRIPVPARRSVRAAAVAVPVPSQDRDTLKVERESENPRPGRTPFKISFPGSCQKRPLPGAAAGQRP